MEFFYHDQDKDTLIVAADDRINSEQADELAGKLEKLINGGVAKVIVDCARVPYVSTVGIGLLLLLHKRLAEKGSEVKLANVKGLVGDILRTLRLDRVFDIHPDIEGARLAYLQPS